MKARLAENPNVTNAKLTEIVKTHPNSEWPNTTPDRITDAITALGDEVTKTDHPTDKRRKLLQLV